MSQALFPAPELGGHAMASARQAALLLHSLADTDRKWLLEQLPSEQAVRLKPLVAELSLLGIPSDQRLLTQLRSVAQASTASGSIPNSVLKATDLRVLQAANATRIAQALTHEPPRLIARVLRMQPWSWAADVMRILPAAVASEVMACREGPSLQLNESEESKEILPIDRLLLKLLRERLDAGVDDVIPQSSVRLGFWARVHRILSGWRSNPTAKPMRVARAEAANG